MTKSRDRPMCGASRRSSRAQSAWNVEIHIPRQSTPSSVSTRVRISSAALLVKVTARIRSGVGRSLADEIGDAMGDDAGLAGARTSQDQQRPIGLSTASCCSGLRLEKEVLSRAGTCSVVRSLQAACSLRRYSTVTVFARFLG